MQITEEERQTDAKFTEKYKTIYVMWHIKLQCVVNGML